MSRNWQSNKPSWGGATVPAADMNDRVIILDAYNSDLHFLINEDGLGGVSLSKGGFANLWAAARATWGVKSGKYMFEVKVERNMEVNEEESEAHPHALRVGWSVAESDLSLGEDKLSYGYGSTGRSSTNRRFQIYGESYGPGDLISCFVDLESFPKTVSFAKNGTFFGPAFQLERELGDKPLFPHIASKNVLVTVNFCGPPWCEMPDIEQYRLIQDAIDYHKIRNVKGPASKEECEVIMMIGLPAAGKTTWAEKHCRENKDKRYTILGTNLIMDKMKVTGLTRKKNYTGRWETLIKKATGMLNELLVLASKSRVPRNYILDQTNVYPGAQKRKMSHFHGYRKKAVIVIPPPHELQRRTMLRNEEMGSAVPDDAINAMKSNFSIPKPGYHFDEVVFSEISGAAAEDIVQQYKDEARAGSGSGDAPSSKRPRYSDGGDARGGNPPPLFPPSISPGGNRDPNFRGVSNPPPPPIPSHSPQEGNRAPPPRSNFSPLDRYGPGTYGSVGGYSSPGGAAYRGEESQGGGGYDRKYGGYGAGNDPGSGGRGGAGGPYGRGYASESSSPGGASYRSGDSQRQGSMGGYGGGQAGYGASESSSYKSHEGQGRGFGGGYSSGYSPASASSGGASYGEGQRRGAGGGYGQGYDGGSGQGPISGGGDRRSYGGGYGDGKTTASASYGGARGSGEDFSQGYGGEYSASNAPRSTSYRSGGGQGDSNGRYGGSGGGSAPGGGAYRSGEGYGGDPGRYGTGYGAASGNVSQTASYKNEGGSAGMGYGSGYGATSGEARYKGREAHGGYSGGYEGAGGSAAGYGYGGEGHTPRSGTTGHTGYEHGVGQGGRGTGGYGGGYGGSYQTGNDYYGRR